MSQSAHSRKPHNHAIILYPSLLLAGSWPGGVRSSGLLVEHLGETNQWMSICGWIFNATPCPARPAGKDPAYLIDGPQVGGLLCVFRGLLCLNGYVSFQNAALQWQNCLLPPPEHMVYPACSQRDGQPSIHRISAPGLNCSSNTTICSVPYSVSTLHRPLLPPLSACRDRPLRLPPRIGRSCMT